MLKSLIVALSLLATSPALAQHAHGVQKGPSGGPMEDVAGVHAELVVSGETLTIHVLDEAGKPIDTAGFTGSAMLISGANRKTVPLVAGGQTLVGKAPAPIAKGTVVTLLIKTPTGKSGQAKFTSP
ncbi:MAG: hypothetical protein B7Y12_02770 [Rhizobiales bacterium 24-66-13]|nr:MAG: hypothetical protein B7Y12_02770 [Rhizobiales bacterium 24-66-13]OZB11976.1 MAG: hypothetical protein B7X67_01535 [Rhizobiales bacterium 39-66-18]HQS45162.1 hypothetical protein [Xanthobacteraceae bacterium]